MSNRELRTAKSIDLEIRGDGNRRTVRGYAAVFDSETVIGGDYFREVIRPGAFARAIEEGADVRALFDHDAAEILGRTKSGSLRLSEDDKGLRIELDLPNTSRGRDIAALLDRGDLDGMSFGFSVRSDRWTKAEGGKLPLRELLDLDLREVSIVTFPAYEETEVSLRARERARQINTPSSEAAASRELATRVRIRRAIADN